MYGERKLLTLYSSLDDVIERTSDIANRLDESHAFTEIACAILILANDIKCLKADREQYYASERQRQLRKECRAEKRHLTLKEQRAIERALNRSVRTIA